MLVLNVNLINGIRKIKMPNQNSNEYLLDIYRQGKERAIRELKQKFLQEQDYVKLAKLKKLLEKNVN